MPHMPMSEHCQKTGEQNCHICENADCNDNTTPSIIRLKQDLANATKVREEIIQAANDPTSDPRIAKTNSVIKSLTQEAKIARLMQQRAEKQVVEIADQCQKFGARLDSLEKVVVEALVTFGGKTIPLKEMVDAVKAAWVIGGSDGE